MPLRYSLERYAMFIQTEGTPNPHTLKFVPGCPVMKSGTANFTHRDDTARSPLAQRLFEIRGLSGVFLGADFITASKDENLDWEVMKPQILGAIMDHLSSGKPVMLDENGDDPAVEAEESDSITAQIKELLDTRVRPAVAQDGGDIIFHAFEDGIVYLHMQGACAGCPSSTATLKDGIENMLRHYIPEVLEVRAVV